MDVKCHGFACGDRLGKPNRDPGSRKVQQPTDLRLKGFVVWIGVQIHPNPAAAFEPNARAAVKVGMHCCDRIYNGEPDFGDRDFGDPNLAAGSGRHRIRSRSI
jgi:hypothetical protein